MRPWPKFAKHGYGVGVQHLRARIETHLASFERVSLDPTGRRQAAVAIVVSPTAQGPAWILTRRALHMRRGAGNYALPGGNIDPGEDPIDAARRETYEELGVELAREGALGLLDDFLTLGGHVVTPVVFWTPEPVTLAPNPEEVHAAWLVPLADLDHPRAPRRSRHPDGGPPILRMFARGSWLNPPTAAWLYQFREVCLHGRPCRTDAIGQPGWTAR
ncbi:NUDIX hydrolase [Phenylobacterium kunshanense]|uniref:Coenzyme A pyrophosphatase n=1 Tax=Phenylobacterium kunshanense TaxID=1445034 RepID=A0A328BIE7_9CAUL|nr:CoA pyrophosphatase [Phenylobacterium kunshanense]RAK64798.1 coenzyme A pyrophosphatase [Phenylobacterium kunshanense]